MVVLAPRSLCVLASPCPTSHPPPIGISLSTAESFRLRCTRVLRVISLVDCFDARRRGACTCNSPTLCSAVLAYLLLCNFPLFLPYVRLFDLSETACVTNASPVVSLAPAPLSLSISRFIVTRICCLSEAHAASPSRLCRPIPSPWPLFIRRAPSAPVVIRAFFDARLAYVPPPSALSRPDIPLNLMVVLFSCYLC